MFAFITKMTPFAYAVVLNTHIYVSQCSLYCFINFRSTCSLSLILYTIDSFLQHLKLFCYFQQRNTAVSIPKVTATVIGIVTPPTPPISLGWSVPLFGSVNKSISSVTVVFSASRFFRIPNNSISCCIWLQNLPSTRWKNYACCFTVYHAKWQLQNTSK